MKWSENEKYIIIERYNNGESSLQIAKDYNVTASSICGLLRRNGCVLRSNKINSRKYSFNENYFKNIDTAEKAYWLGFIAADGYVQTHNSYTTKYIGITLAEKDIKHLEKFKTSIEYTGPIKIYNYHGYTDSKGAKILLCSENMYNDLVIHGIVEHKSNILNRPNIPKKFAGAYILGYFDGDGSIYATEKSCGIKFVGTDDILNYIIEYLSENGIDCENKAKNKRHENDIVEYISFGGYNKIIKIMNLLYSNVIESIPLERKYQKYLNFKNSRSNK